MNSEARVVGPLASAIFILVLKMAHAQVPKAQPLISPSVRSNLAHVNHNLEYKVASNKAHSFWTLKLVTAVNDSLKSHKVKSASVYRG